MQSPLTLRFLLYVLVLLYVLFGFFFCLNQLYVLDNLNKNPLYWFFYYYTTLPIKNESLCTRDLNEFRSKKNLARLAITNF